MIERVEEAGLEKRVRTAESVWATERSVEIGDR
jgi:hypothetical protein